jgi:hypothetical protein
MARKEKPVPVRIVNEPISPPRDYKEPDRYHMSMREIENGWIVNEHGYKDGKHFDRERFEPRPPSFPVRSRSVNEKPERSRISAGPAARSDTAQRAVKSPGETTSSSFMRVDMQAPPAKVRARSPLNVPSDAALPRPKRSSPAQRLRNAKL